MDIIIRGSKGTKTVAFDKALIKALSDKHPNTLTIVLNGLNIGQAEYVINTINDCSIMFEYYDVPIASVEDFKNAYYTRIADYIRNIHIQDTLRVMQYIQDLPKALDYIETQEFIDMINKYDITITQSNIPYYDSVMSNTRNWDYRLASRLGLSEHDIVVTEAKWHDSYFITTMDKLQAYYQLQFYIQNGIEPFKEEVTEPIPEWILY